jgi:hypothetical protein
MDSSQSKAPQPLESEFAEDDWKDRAFSSSQEVQENYYRSVLSKWLRPTPPDVILCLIGAYASEWLVVGALIDVEDTTSRRNWGISRVEDVDVEKSAVLIHFFGWSNKWNTWIPKDSPRLAPLYSKTTPIVPPVTPGDLSFTGPIIRCLEELGLPQERGAVLIQAYGEDRSNAVNAFLYWKAFGGKGLPDSVRKIFE